MYIYALIGDRSQVNMKNIATTCRRVNLIG